MIELKLIQDNGIKAQLLEKMGIQASDAICYGAADKEEVLGGTAFAIRDGRAVMLGLFTEPGLGAMLGDGLIRAAWNHCSSHGIKTARFSDEFPMESLQPLEFFRDFSHEDIDIEKFFSEGKKCGQTR